MDRPPPTPPRRGRPALVVGAARLGPAGAMASDAVTLRARGAGVFVGPQPRCRGRNRKNMPQKAEGEWFPADASGAAVSRRWWRVPQDIGRIDVLDNQCRCYDETGKRGRGVGSRLGIGVSVNLKSAFLAMPHVIPVMARQGGGRHQPSRRSPRSAMLGSLWSAMPDQGRDETKMTAHHGGSSSRPSRRRRQRLLRG